MKNLYLFFALLLCSTGYGQYNLIFQGRLVDLSSNGISGVIVVQNSDTLVNGLTFSKWIYTDSYGNFFDTILQPNIDSGKVTITVIACNTQTTSDSTYTVVKNFFGGDFYTGCNNPVLCDADFNVYYDTSYVNGEQYTFYNTSTGTSLSYNWYFGDGNSSTQQNPTHVYTTAGTYDVVLFISNGTCMDSIIKQVQVNPRCYAGFVFSNLNNSLDHQADPFITSYSNYYWYFGDGNTSTLVTPTHTYATGGSYAVTLVVMDSIKNCLDSSTQYIKLCNSGGFTGNYGVGGTVYAPGLDTNDHIRVYLIEYDSAAGTLTAVDSMNTSLNMYYFSGYTCTGTYLVKAALLPASASYNDYFPTYFDSSLLYSGAIPVAITMPAAQADIHLIAGTNPGGPGFIGGYVNMGANKNGEGLEGILVLLLDENNNPVAYTYTTAGGRYEFKNIPLGKYKIRIEIPGKPSAEYSVTLTTDKPAADDNNFDVNKKDITLSIRPALFLQSQVKLYPNPTAGQLHIEVNLKAGADVTVKIYDVTGKIHETSQVTFTEGNNVLELNTQQLRDGLYFLSLESKEGSYTSRFIQVK